MKDKQYAVLGLGVFGSTVATTLAEYGCEVLAIDKDLTCVERIATEVTKAVVADVTNREELTELGLGDFDVAIVAIGNHLEEGVLATMILKEMGVPYVIAKAKNKQFMQILEKIGADKVVRAEKDMGIRTAKKLLRRNIVDLVELDEEYSIVEIKAPSSWQGKTLQALNVRNIYHINVLGVRTIDSEKLSLNIGPDYLVQHEDRFLVLAETTEIEKFDYLIKD